MMAQGLASSNILKASHWTPWGALSSLIKAIECRFSGWTDVWSGALALEGRALAS